MSAKLFGDFGTLLPLMENPRNLSTPPSTLRAEIIYGWPHILCHEWAHQSWMTLSCSRNGRARATLITHLEAFLDQAPILNEDINYKMSQNFQHEMVWNFLSAQLVRSLYRLNKWKTKIDPCLLPFMRSSDKYFVIPCHVRKSWRNHAIDNRQSSQDRTSTF